MNTFSTETGDDSSVLATYFGKRIQKHIEEIQQILTKLSDTLLLKLISGKLLISEAEQLTEEAI